MHRQLGLARQRVARSKELVARSTAAMVLPYHGAAFPPPGSPEPPAGPEVTPRSFAAVTELIERIEDASARDADLAGRLVEDILVAINVVAEPSLLMGILLEGLAETVLERLSEEERRETAIALCTLLWDRINQDATE
ncbi:MAG TPA: hypothetical protein VL614_12175 [Acetobacteraceae bacterium]|nr:hypothetical protein [Acetobacteraceae bacterium]